MGYINKAGRMVIKAQFDSAWKFSDGLALVEIDDKRGYIDAQGILIVKPQFNMARDFSEGLAAVLVGDGTCDLCGEWVYIDKTGNIVIRTALKNGEQQVGDFSEGLAFFRDWQSMHGFIDKSGKVVIEPKFGYAGDFHYGLAEVAIGQMRYGWGYIDKTGKLVIPANFKAQVPSRKG